MKEETQASIPASAGTRFEGVLDIRRHPIDPEHYHTVAKATAEALAEEIARRFHPDTGYAGLQRAAANLLTEWFTGKWTPGGKP